MVNKSSSSAVLYDRLEVESPCLLTRTSYLLQKTCAMMRHSCNPPVFVTERIRGVTYNGEYH